MWWHMQMHFYMFESFLLERLYVTNLLHRFSVNVCNEGTREESKELLVLSLFTSKGSSSQGYDFSCGHVWMWKLDCEESWAPKNRCFWTVVLEKTLESPFDCKEIQSVHSEDQPWDFFGRNDAKAQTPVLWPLYAKSWLIGKDSDAGRDWGQEEKATAEDEMAAWHHRLNGHEFGWTPGVGDGQGGLVCCDSWGRKESDTTEWLNWTELRHCSKCFIFLTHYIFTVISYLNRWRNWNISRAAACPCDIVRSVTRTWTY